MWSFAFAPALFAMPFVPMMMWFAVAEAVLDSLDTPRRPKLRVVK